MGPQCRCLNALLLLLLLQVRRVPLALWRTPSCRIIRAPAPQSLPLSCRPRSLFQESLDPKGLSSLEAARRSGLGGGGSASG